MKNLLFSLLFLPFLSLSQNGDSFVSPYQKELDEALENKSIDDYYKEIYKKEKLISSDDNQMLSITENLFTEDLSLDLFYFIVFTKSMNGSDGFYSEALGLSAYEFISTQTEKFADFFNIGPKLFEKDMDNWVEHVYGEIQISNEGHEKKAVRQLEVKLLENIIGARKEYSAIILLFIDKLHSRMGK